MSSADRWYLAVLAFLIYRYTAGSSQVVRMCEAFMFWLVVWGANHFLY